MNMKIACPHCQVVGLIPDELRKTSGWPVACHHCHQHYFVPVVSSPTPLSRQVELSCTGCGQLSALDKQAYEIIVAERFPLFCQACHASLSTEQADIIDLERPPSDTAHQAVGLRSALALIFAGFFIVSVSVMAAHEGLISRDWLDNLLLNLPDRTSVVSYLTDALNSSSKTEQ